MPGLLKVISGGQTGVDRGALRAAKAAGVATGGWMPPGWLAEDGSHPEYAALYGMRACTTGSYPERTRRNIEDSDATLILAGIVLSPGTELTISLCGELVKPLVVFDPASVSVAECVAVLQDVTVVNVAGNRESTSPGVERWTEHFLGDVFAALRARS